MNEAFDGPRDGRIFTVCPRGKAGSSAAAQSSTPTGNDMMTLLMESLIPVIGGLSRKRSHSHSESPRQHASTSHIQHSTPKRVRLELQTPKHIQSELDSPKPPCSHQYQQPPSHGPSPSVPAPGFELHACLRDFSELEGVDMAMFESALQAEDYTPDMIALADESATAAIRSITGATGGRVLKLKLFCKKWQTDYERKISSGDYTTYELLP